MNNNDNLNNTTPTTTTPKNTPKSVHAHYEELELEYLESVGGGLFGYWDPRWGEDPRFFIEIIMEENEKWRKKWRNPTGHRADSIRWRDPYNGGWVQGWEAR